MIRKGWHLREKTETSWGKVGFKESMEAVAIGSDAELMLRVRDGDEDSFACLLVKHRDPVVNYLHRMVQNAGVAEELAQDVFLRVYRARKGYEPTAKFTTWLYRIATHVALNSLRDGRHARNMVALDDDASDWPHEVRDPGPTVEENLVETSKGWEIRRAVEALPEKQRAAVILHKYQDLDYKEIAQSLDCSESAVKSLLFRAYETLRGRLGHLTRR
jgi:RNA polymerase sigma-70 factor, ECF subfamily